MALRGTLDTILKWNKTEDLVIGLKICKNMWWQPRIKLKSESEIYILLHFFWLSFYLNYFLLTKFLYDFYISFRLYVLDNFFLLIFKEIKLITNDNSVLSRWSFWYAGCEDICSLFSGRRPYRFLSTNYMFYQSFNNWWTSTTSKEDEFNIKHSESKCQF